MVVVMKMVSENYVKNVKAARKSWPGAIVLDPTLGGAMKKLDPACPIGRVKAPGKKWIESLSILGIWEGLKVFSKKDVVDYSFLKDERKLGKVRGCKSYGRMIGIRIDEEVIDESVAVDEVFVKLYKETIGKRFGNLIEGIKEQAKSRTVVLLDYPEGKEKYPKSHVEILKEMIEE